jgi:hypothetical protein
LVRPRDTSRDLMHVSHSARVELEVIWDSGGMLEGQVTAAKRGVGQEESPRSYRLGKMPQSGTARAGRWKGAPLGEQDAEVWRLYLSRKPPKQISAHGR